MKKLELPKGYRIQASSKRWKLFFRHTDFVQNPDWTVSSNELLIHAEETPIRPRLSKHMHQALYQMNREAAKERAIADAVFRRVS